VDPAFRGTLPLQRAHDPGMKKRILRTKWATVERPGDVGMDLPAGVTAQQLLPTDYHPVDMEQAEEKKPVAKKARAVATKVRRALRPHH
jgi:hypothetical protein